MLDHISLKSYRNLTLEAGLSPLGNIIIAPNGSGKSNFLESIYFATHGRSYKQIQHRSELIQHQQDFARIELKFETQLLEAVIANPGRMQVKFSLNGKRRSVSELSGKFPTIIFAPHSVDLVSSDPASRRDDLDDYLAMITSDYAETISRYKQILKNRNALLKNIRDHNSGLDQLRYWTQELIRLAVTLYTVRSQYFREMSTFLTQSAAELYGRQAGEFSLAYTPNAVTTAESELSPDDYHDQLQMKFNNNEAKEVIVGQTLYGPHKDDYILFLGGENLRYLGSRGQQRLSIFIWKLAQHEFMYSKRGTYPLFLIDDLMSELDNGHRDLAANYLTNAGWQFILTSADTKEVPAQLQEQALKIDLGKN